MTKYLLLYKFDPTTASAMPAPTPDEGAAMMAAWNAWGVRAGESLIDFGSPTAPASEGADAGLGGYTILQTESRDALDALLDGHPHRTVGGTIEVHEFQPLPGM